MARVLIVGCGCRGRSLAHGLTARGHAVRGTTRSADSLPDIDAAGAEGVVADPLMLATIATQLQGVSVLCWLMGSAEGAGPDIKAIHGPRLESLIGMLVDTPVRGLVYEAAGTVDEGVLEQGALMARANAATHRMPMGVIEADPADLERWLAAALDAVEEVLA